MFKTFLRITFLILYFFSFKIKNHTKTCCDFYSFGNKNISQGIELTTNGLKFYSNEEIFLFTWPFDEEKIYVVYGNIKPEEKHFVYGEVFWVQTIILKKTDLENFKKVVFNKRIFIFSHFTIFITILIISINSFSLWAIIITLFYMVL